MSARTGTWTEAFFVNRADGSAVVSTASEATLLNGLNDQPIIPALFFDGNKVGKAIKLWAKGVFSNTGTPTMIFQVRLGTTQGSSLAGNSIGVTTAITTASGITNQQWELYLDLVCTVPGFGTNNCTVAGAGWVDSPGGFASPFKYALQPTTPPTGTWTVTFDASLTQYINLSMTWSASSASNTCTLKQLEVLGLN